MTERWRSWASYHDREKAELVAERIRVTFGYETRVLEVHWVQEPWRFVHWVVQHR